MPASMISAARTDPSGKPFIDVLHEFAEKDYMRVNLNLVMSQ